MSRTLTIGEVARRAGVAGSTLRYYERRGLIAPAGRGANGRIYPPEVLDRLRIIRYFQQAGYTLAEIGEVFDRGTDWREGARRKRDELEARIASLVQARALLDAALACGCDDVEGCDADLDLEDLERPPPPEAEVPPCVDPVPVRGRARHRDPGRQARPRLLHP